MEDLGSKLGTRVDGQSLKGAKLELKSNEHSLKLGNHEHLLRHVLRATAILHVLTSITRVKWHPAVLTFSFSTKESKNKDPLAQYRARLEDLDIKAIDSYVVTKTTHVVQSKRNTVKGLQALVNGKYIVTQSYVDALVYAATPDDLEQEEHPSPLERDFDAAWPDATKYLPAPGKEPTDRPAAAFAPTVDRTMVFQHFTFVCCDAEQHESLQAPITNGHGKALLFELDYGNTSVDDMVKYMQNAAGKKGFGEPSTETEEGGVILVRMHKAKPGFENWVSDLYMGVTRRLEQAPLEQGAFLDAILGNDATALRKPFVPDSIDGVVGTPTPEVTDTTSFRTIKPPQSSPPRPTSSFTGQTIEPESPPPETAAMTEPTPRRARPRTTVPGRIKTFDDGFDMEAIPDYTMDGEDSEDNMPESVDAEASGTAASQTDANDITCSTRKRTHPPSDHSDVDIADDLLLAANALKRRRLDIEAENRRQGITAGPEKASAMVDPSKQPIKRLKRKEKEIDVREAVRNRREKEDAAATVDRETLEHVLDGMDLESMKRLAVIEEMPLPVRTNKPAPRSSAETDQWHGRKNFKKFRRSDKNVIRERGSRVQKKIVQVEEAPRKMYGIGDAYWEDSPRSKAKEKGRSQRSATLTQSQKLQHSNDRIISEVKNEVEEIGPESTSPAMTRLQEEAAELVGDIDVEQPRQTRLADKTQQSQQTMNTQSQRKRPASGGTNGTAVKRTKTRLGTGSASRQPERNDDSDSGDELKFRFRSRKKG